jgi:hypothetical protein
MANISFADYENKKSNTNTGTKEYKVGYFSLKDDGDETVVRFAHSSVQDLSIVTVHDVKVTTKEGKELYKRVSCLREAHEPLSKCPLCTAGIKVSDKFFVKLIEYVKDENGNVTPKARVWERPAKYARKLKSLMDEYGDLTNHIFKIKRRGARGSMKTDYDEIFIPATSPIYKPEVYVKDFSDFEGFKMAGSFYLVKTADEINSFLKMGYFPKTEAIPEKTNSYSRPAVNTAASFSTPQATQPQPSEQVKPTGQSNPIEGRPQRYKF